MGEAEVHRIAGEVALKSLAPSPEKAEAHFDRALEVARRQQTKSWELRTAMSWRGSGAITASGMRLASFSPRSTAGSRRASTRAI
jgi:hypothetical protein